MAWMSWGEEECALNQKLIRFVVTGVLLLGLFAPILQIVHFSTAQSPQSTGTTLLKISSWISLIIAFAPPLAAASIALAAVFNFSALSKTYGQTKIRLHEMKNNFRILLLSLRSAETAEQVLESEKILQSLILETEQILTDEMLQWKNISNRGEHSIV